MRPLRANAMPTLAVAVLWFLFFGPTRWWAGVLGPERAVLILGIFLGISLITGMAWPGPTRSLLAAAAALFGFVLSLLILGSPIEPGDANQLPTIGLLAALFAFYAHLGGTAVRFGIQRWRGATA